MVMTNSLSINNLLLIFLIRTLLAEESEPFTQVVCILFCNYKHNNNND